MAFERIAPYLQDPWIVIGFFIFSASLFCRLLINKGVIPPLSRAHGYQVLKQILLYAFIIGLLLIFLGFVTKYRQIDNQLKAAAVASIESNFRDVLNRVSGISEMAKNEIINQTVEGFLSGAMSKEQIEARIDEIKVSLIQNVRAPTNQRDQGNPNRNRTIPALQSSTLPIFGKSTDSSRKMRDKENKLDVFTPAFGSSNVEVRNSPAILTAPFASYQEEQPSLQPEQSLPHIDRILPSMLTSVRADQDVTILGSQFQTGLTIRASSPNRGTTFTVPAISSITEASLVMTVVFDRVGVWSIRVFNPDGGHSNRFLFYVKSNLNPASEVYCGNGRIEWPEQCDDGNNVDGDGCSKDCEIEHSYFSLSPILHSFGQPQRL